LLYSKETQKLEDAMNQNGKSAATLTFYWNDHMVKRKVAIAKD